MTMKTLDGKRARVMGMVLMLVASGCGDSDDGGANMGGGGADAGTDSGSSAGESLACEDGDMCDLACTEAACTVECVGAGTRCTAECPEGECTQDADLGAVAAFDCAGGGCVTDCDGASDCTVDCGGGGCEIGCDGESKCKVLCGDGEPCNVFCEAGSTAFCEAGECVIEGCEPCDATDIDESYMPSLDPENFSPDITNELFPLKVGAKWVYEAPGEIITVEVLDETKTIAGVETRVVHDQVTDEAGVLIEDTYDWYAQDADGNVWYFGEETNEYVNGKEVNAHGAWETGVDGALPGIIMYAETPEVGTIYKQEYLRCVAEDTAEVLAVGESVETPAGSWDDCVRMREFSPLEPQANEHKLFCPGVGVAVVEDVVKGESSGEPVEQLVEVTGL